ncbi:MAG: hypothetical protein ACRYG2_21400, partial [Janthinobacterium lividum]
MAWGGKDHAGGDDGEQSGCDVEQVGPGRPEHEVSADAECPAQEPSGPRGWTGGSETDDELTERSTGSEDEHSEEQGGYETDQEAADQAVDLGGRVQVEVGYERPPHDDEHLSDADPGSPVTDHAEQPPSSGDQAWSTGVAGLLSGH